MTDPILMGRERPVDFRDHEILAALRGDKNCLLRLKTQDEAKCPLGAVQDHLWVREAHAMRKDIDWHIELERARHYLHYRADAVSFRPEDEMNWHDYGKRWRAAQMLPRPLSRFTYVVTAIDQRRLNELDAPTCLGYGIGQTSYWKPVDVAHRPFEDKWWDDFEFWTRYPQVAYRAMWEAEETVPWDINPQMWVVRIARIKPETLW